MKIYSQLLLSLLAICSLVHARNQTLTTTPVSRHNVTPFTITIKKTSFHLPHGLHSGASAEYNGLWLFVAGRTNGLHGFEDDKDNFPPQKQNTTIYVVDFANKKVWSRSLNDKKSGLTATQIDSLTVTAPQFYQTTRSLYITGGYGVNTNNGEFSTKDFFTAIDIRGLIYWVQNPSSSQTAAESIRQLRDERFRVTGGIMGQVGNGPTLLMFGQNFSGFYTDASNGAYTKQIRKFYILDDGKRLAIKFLAPSVQEEAYRRRDLNIPPMLYKDSNGRVVPGFVALAGVFTKNGAGCWTVPVTISAQGVPTMANPRSKSTFKQGMNVYKSARCGLYSVKNDVMYQVILGGITYTYFSGDTVEKDEEFPFTNQITAIRRNNKGRFAQIYMGQYPTIKSTGTNKGNKLLFGTGAYFMNAFGVDVFESRVIKLDSITQPTTIGYVVGGIQSTVPNTTTKSDSAASPYIFEVIVTPKT